MQGIDWKLYQEDPFYRDLVDRMLENEQEGRSPAAAVTCGAGTVGCRGNL